MGKQQMSDTELDEKIKEKTEVRLIDGEPYIRYKTKGPGIVREFTLQLSRFNKLTKAQKSYL